MHPSKVHQSTAKPARPAAQVDQNGLEHAASEVQAESTDTTVAQHMPTKFPGAWPSQISSPTFDFSLGRDESILSVEAQRIMDSVRGEAAKIKAQMQAERAKQDHLDHEADHLYRAKDREIVKPRGKTGRFSNVHMQEFKKMDSIAGHASAWKTKPHTDGPSLKRSNSQANHDKEGVVQQLMGFKVAKTSKSVNPIGDQDREDQGPGKRVKTNQSDDTSSTRPRSRDQGSQNNVPSTPLKSGWQSKLPSATVTPTQSSLARAASVRHQKTSMLPSFGPGQSSKGFRSPRVSRTEISKKYLASLARFGGMKSILYRYQPRFSNDPFKADDTARVPAPKSNLWLDRRLPSVPSTVQSESRRSPIFSRRVDLTLHSTSQQALTVASSSPSPSKIPGPQLNRSETRRVLLHESVDYPSLADSPNITTRTAKIARPSNPRDFTFRADKTIEFGPVQSGPMTPTIRQVRPSGIATPLAAFNNLSAFENLPPIPHGLSNKKRRRANSDDGEDAENVAPVSATNSADDELPKAKKVKVLLEKNGPAEKRKTSKTPGFSRIPRSGGVKEKGKRTISLSRLNLLARPKERR